MSTFGTPDPQTKILEDIDFVLYTGVVLPVTLDWAAGDELIDNTDHYVVKIKAHKSLMDGSKTIPAKELTIFKDKLGYIHQTTREVSELTPEQQVMWKQ